MRIEIQMFAAARELAGRETIQVEVADAAVARDVMDAIGRQLPEINQLLPACRLAIDNCYATDDAHVSESNDVALIPPVSGG
jgi:molybdopterin converting factor small subunit